MLDEILVRHATDFHAGFCDSICEKLSRGGTGFSGIYESFQRYFAAGPRVSLADIDSRPPAAAAEA